MGVIDLNAPSATYIDDLPANLRRGGTAAIAQSGSVTDAFVHAGTRIGWSRIISCGSEAVLDLCDYLAACLDDPSDRFDRALRRGLQAARTLPRPRGPRARRWTSRSSRSRSGAARRRRAAAIAHTGSLAGDDRATEAALRAAGVVRCDDLDDLIEAAALAAARGGSGAARGQGPDRRRHRLDRRGLADRRPRAAARARPATDPGSRACGDHRGAADPDPHREPVRSVGRRRGRPDLPRLLRGVRRRRVRYDVARARPRFPVPLAARRGRARGRAGRGADRRHRGAADVLPVSSSRSRPAT